MLLSEQKYIGLTAKQVQLALLVGCRTHRVVN